MRYPLRLVWLLFVWSGAVLSADDLDKAVLPPNPTEAQVRSYLKTIQHFLQNNYETEYQRIGIMNVRVPEPAMLKRLDDKFAAVTTDRLELLLTAMARSGSPVFEQLAANSVISPGRTGFRSEHKDVVYRNLARFPKLILLIERMEWLDLTEPGFVKAWKLTKQTRVDGMVDEIGFRLALISARGGWKDGLITVAQSAQKRARHRHKPDHAQNFAAECDMLELLMPRPERGEKLAESILANRDRLRFDPVRTIYNDDP